MENLVGEGVSGERLSPSISGIAACASSRFGCRPIADHPADAPSLAG